MRLIPGISPRELKRMLKRMGIDLVELRDVEEVVIKLRDKEVVLSSPQVMVLDMGKQKVFQITSREVVERERVVEEAIEFSEEDIEFIIEQTGASRDKAIEALKKAKGDLAEAIIIIREGRV